MFYTSLHVLYSTQLVLKSNTANKFSSELSNRGTRATTGPRVYYISQKDALRKKYIYEVPNV